MSWDVAESEAVEAPPRAVVLRTLRLSTFLIALNAFIITPALPKIADEFGGIEYYGIASASYIVASATFLPVWGRLSDLYGRARIYVVSFLLFLLGSLLTGFAWSMPSFIAFRALQGGASSGILTISFAIAAAILSPDEAPRFQGGLAGIWAISSIIGPIIGGAITRFLSWRTAFYVNPVVTLALLLVAIRWREEARDRDEAAVDPKGVLLLVLALGGIFCGLSLSEATIFVRGGFAAGGLVAAALFALVERRSSTPILEVSLFSIPVFRAISLTGLFLGVLMFVPAPLSTLYAQSVLGLDPIKAGLTIVPIFVALGFVSPFSGPLLEKAGERGTVMLGAAACTAGSALLVLLDEHSGVAALLVAHALVGAGLGLLVAPLLNLAQQSTPQHDLGSATALTQFLRQLGGSLGLALAGAILAAGVVGSPGLGRPATGPATVAVAKGDDVRAFMAHALRPAFGTLLVASVLLLVATARVRSKNDVSPAAGE